MPSFLTDYAAGSKAVLGPEMALNDLAKAKADTRSTEQQNDIRQLAVDSTKSLGELIKTQAENTPDLSADTSKSLDQIVPPTEDVFHDYQQLSDANKRIESGSAELKKLEAQVKAAQNTPYYNETKSTYDIKKKQVEEAKAEQTDYRQRHLNSMLSAGLSVGPNGEGWAQTRDLFIKHDQAAARASGVTDPQRLKEREQWMKGQLPEAWTSTTKAVLSNMSKELQDTKTILEAQKIEDARIAKEEERKIEDKRLSIQERQLNHAVQTGDRTWFDDEIKVQSGLLNTASNVINRYNIDEQAAIKQRKEVAEQNKSHWFNRPPSAEETQEYETATEAYNTMQEQLAQANATMTDANVRIKKLQEIRNALPASKTPAPKTVTKGKDKPGASKDNPIVLK